MEVRAGVQQYRVQSSGELTRAAIGEIDFSSNRVDLSVSIEDIFPGEEWCCVLLCEGNARDEMGSSVFI